MFPKCLLRWMSEFPSGSLVCTFLYVSPIEQLKTRRKCSSHTHSEKQQEIQINKKPIRLGRTLVVIEFLDCELNPWKIRGIPKKNFNGTIDREIPWVRLWKMDLKRLTESETAWVRTLFLKSKLLYILSKTRTVKGKGGFEYGRMWVSWKPRLEGCCQTDTPHETSEIHFNIVIYLTYYSHHLFISTCGWYKKVLTRDFTFPFSYSIFQVRWVRLHPQSHLVSDWPHFTCSQPRVVHGSWNGLHRGNVWERRAWQENRE